MSIEARRAFIEAGAATGDNVGAANRPNFRIDPFWRHSTDLSERRWEAVIVPKIARFSEFPDGWDGYKAKRIGYEACMFAINVLNNIMRPATPCPQVVPTASGSVLLEWHERGIDLEVRISGAYKCELYYEDTTKPNDPPQELSIGADLTALIRYLDDLARR